MSYIITSKVHARGLRKPSPSARIDPQHWAAQGLVGCWLMTGWNYSSERSVVGGQSLVGGAGLTRVADGWLSNGATNAFFKIPIGTDPKYTSGAETSTLLWDSLNAVPSNGVVACKGAFSGGGWYLQRSGSTLYVMTNSLAGSKSGTGYSYQQNKRQITSVRINATHCSVYSDGNLAASDELVASYVVGTNPLAYFGYTPTGTLVCPCLLQFGCFHDRALSPSEISRLHAEPYSMFYLPGARRIFLPVEAGGPTYGELSGAASLSLTPAGTLTARGALAGAGALSLTPTATLTAHGALAGAASVSLTASGTLTGSGALAGAGSVALTASGTLTAHGALSGAATVTLTASGNLTGETAGAISGTATLTLTAGGTLTAYGALTGAATLTLTASGAIENGAEVDIASVNIWTVEPRPTRWAASRRSTVWRADPR